MATYRERREARAERLRGWADKRETKAAAWSARKPPMLEPGAVEDFRTARECPRCRYTIHPGYFHEEMPQPEGASHVVCKLQRTDAILRGPMMDVISTYLDEASHG